MISSDRYYTGVSDSDSLIDLSDYPLLLSVDQVAAALGCSVPAVRKRLQRRELTFVKAGRHVRVPREALRQYLLSRLVPALETRA